MCIQSLYVYKYTYVYIQCIYKNFIYIHALLTYIKKYIRVYKLYIRMYKLCIHIQSLYTYSLHTHKTSRSGLLTVFTKQVVVPQRGLVWTRMPLTWEPSNERRGKKRGDVINAALSWMDVINGARSFLFVSRMQHTLVACRSHTRVSLPRRPAVVRVQSLVAPWSTSSRWSLSRCRTPSMPWTSSKHWTLSRG